MLRYYSIRMPTASTAHIKSLSAAKIDYILVPMRSYHVAHKAALMLTRMTGDGCVAVESEECKGSFEIMRWTGSRWVRG